MEDLAIQQTDVAIVGAGPAGLAASGLLSRHGAACTVIDEQRAAGGQILRQPPREFRVRNWLPGRLYGKGKALLQGLESMPGVTWRFSTTVLGLFPNDDRSTAERYPWRIWLSGPEGAEFMLARKVLVAPGCYDRPVAFPGWMLPGVMAAGGLQAMLKSQQLIPGDRIVLAGSHPLQLIVADQIVKAGGRVEGVYFAQSQRQLLSAPWSPATLWANRFKYAEALASRRRLRRAGVPVRFGWTVTEAVGDGRVEGLVVAPVGPDGRPDRSASRTVACDLAGICFGFLVSSELARQGGASASWSEARGGWIVRHDRWMRSDRQDLSVAGEITGVEGSDVAMLEGGLAALGLLLDLGRLDEREGARIAAPLRREREQHRAFARHLRQGAQAPPGLLDSLADDDTVLCRCEGISVGRLRQMMHEHDTLVSANAVKLLCRPGMGPCQGRYCGHNVQNLIARVRGLSPEAVGGFTPQPPVKPVAIGRVLAGLKEQGGS